MVAIFCVLNTEISSVALETFNLSTFLVRGEVTLRAHIGDMRVFSRFRHPKKARGGQQIPAGNAEVPTTRQEPQRPTANAEAPTIPQEQQKPKTNTEAPTAQGTAAQDNGASKASITDSDTRFELWVEARSRLEKQEQWKTLQEYVVPLQVHNQIFN